MHTCQSSYMCQNNEHDSSPKEILIALGYAIDKLSPPPQSLPTKPSNRGRCTEMRTLTSASLRGPRSTGQFPPNLSKPHSSDYRSLMLPGPSVHAFMVSHGSRLPAQHTNYVSLWCDHVTHFFLSRDSRGDSCPLDCMRTVVHALVVTVSSTGRSTSPKSPIQRALLGIPTKRLFSIHGGRVTLKRESATLMDLELLL